MRLLRLATVYYQPAQQGLDSWRMLNDGVSVDVADSWERDGKLGMLLVAQLDLAARPELTDNNRIKVPEHARKRAEAAIEASANLVAVAGRCSRTISSPLPYIALVPNDDLSRIWLDSTDGFEVSFEGGLSVRSPSPLSLTDMVEPLNDRQDGVALLAEALQHVHATGRFHEFLRLFERAFRLGPYHLIDPLSLFLQGAELGYTRQEVERWLIGLRHPATHADRRDEFLLESDIQPVIDRMEQAAYDVLFNKADWRDASAERRTVWVPLGGTRSADSRELFVKHDVQSELRTAVFDGFFAYPLDPTVRLRELPPGWWTSSRTGPNTDTGLSGASGNQALDLGESN